MNTVKGRFPPGVKALPADQRCAFGCPYDPPVKRATLLMVAGDHVGTYDLCQWHLDRLEDKSWHTVELIDLQEIPHEGQEEAGQASSQADNQAPPDSPGASSSPSDSAS